MKEITNDRFKPVFEALQNTVKDLDKCIAEKMAAAKETESSKKAKYNTEEEFVAKNSNYTGSCILSINPYISQYNFKCFFRKINEIDEKMHAEINTTLLFAFDVKENVVSGTLKDATAQFISDLLCSKDKINKVEFITFNRYRNPYDFIEYLKGNQYSVALTVNKDQCGEQQDLLAIPGFVTYKSFTDITFSEKSNILAFTVNCAINVLIEDTNREDIISINKFLNYTDKRTISFTAPRESRRSTGSNNNINSDENNNESSFIQDLINQYTTTISILNSIVKDLSNQRSRLEGAAVDLDVFNSVFDLPESAQWFKKIILTKIDVVAINKTISSAEKNVLANSVKNKYMKFVERAFKDIVEKNNNRMKEHPELLKNTDDDLDFKKSIADDVYRCMQQLRSVFGIIDIQRVDAISVAADTIVHDYNRLKIIDLRQNLLVMNKHIIASIDILTVPVPTPDIEILRDRVCDISALVVACDAKLKYNELLSRKMSSYPISDYRGATIADGYTIDFGTPDTVVIEQEALPPELGPTNPVQVDDTISELTPPTNPF